MKPLLRILFGLLLIAALLWLFFTALLVAIVIALVMAVIGGILTALGLKPRVPVAEPPPDPLGIGVRMEVDEYIENGCPVVNWNVQAQTWDDFAKAVDPFLAASIAGAVRAYGGDQVEWLVVQHEAEAGALIVYPADRADPVPVAERVCYSLRSVYLGTAYARTRPADDSYEQLNRRVWTVVSECLRNGQAARALAEARRTHPMRLAGSDYFSGVDPGRLQVGSRPEVD